MFLKRALDLILATVAVGLFTPIFVVVGLMIWVIDGLPVFYVSVRIGKNKRPFNLIKFRTMRADSVGPQSKITLGSSDARITPLGTRLRKFKVDELPQLFNVILGDMSIVGPRPEDPQYVALYSDDDLVVFRFRPGLTDVTVTKGHLHDAALLDKLPEESRESFYREVLMKRKLKLNISYVNSWSIFSDLMIVFKTALLLLGLTRDRIPEEMYEKASTIKGAE